MHRSLALVLVLCGACGPRDVAEPRTGTPEDRAALFDYVLTKTLEREAFSPVKNARLSLDVERDMRRYRGEVVAAETDERLFYALAKVSAARKDRHLRVLPVPGGLVLRDTVGIGQSNYPERGAGIPHAPVRFQADFGVPGDHFLFLSDYSRNIGDWARDRLPHVGDRLLAVNGQPFAEYVAAVEPYHRYATANGLWWQLAADLPRRSAQFPPWIYQPDLTLELERPDGERYRITVPYLPPDRIVWEGHGEPRYPDFNPVFATETYELYRAAEGRPVLLLQWHGFGDALVADVERLVAFADENGLLDYAIIFDGTRSRGGSLGAYAIQRLSPRSFRTTFGNLRISDITRGFIRNQRIAHDEALASGASVPAGLDDGGWLMDWLENDVARAIDEGRDYTDDVPFKLAHAPKDSDGVLRPAPLHFRGPLVVFLGPFGGSHLDQFASIVADNDLGHIIGMPAAGYSNTWEWEETLVFQATGQPVVRFMWSIGHTIRPNGEVLEGNPAAVDEYLPVTRDNYPDYYATLVQRALDWLAAR